MTERLRCPECRQGKCVNCTGHAWDDSTDTLVACLCGHAAPSRTHTRTSTPFGPDYCAECSEAISEWVRWPCERGGNQ